MKSAMMCVLVMLMCTGTLCWGSSSVDAYESHVTNVSSAVKSVQVTLMCTATQCWGSSCYSDKDGSCGNNLNSTNVNETVALVTSTVRLVLPQPVNATSQNCESKCFTNQVGGPDRSLNARDASARVDKLVENLNKLINDIKDDEEKVDGFSKDLDWPTIKATLEATLKPDDPALEQAKAITSTDMKDVFMEVLYSGHVELLEKLLDLGLDANVPWGANNSTALHAVASTGREDIADLLFSRGALVDARADWNVTPLLRAAASHQPGMVRWLLNHGADTQVADAYGCTALHFAAREDDLETVKILVKAGVPVEAFNDIGITAKEEADVLGYEDVAEYLASKEALNNSV